MLFPIKKILCTTDFSEASYAGIEAANEMALKDSAGVILVHVAAPVPVLGAPHHATPVAFDVPAYQQEFVEKTEETIQHLAKTKFEETLNVKTRVEVGYAADEVARIAEDEGVDLIVISTHGHTGFQRFLLGSVTERVIRYAPCPVLSVRAPSEE
jgi:nucleotide-binding universal stress UspA family protein